MVHIDAKVSMSRCQAEFICGQGCNTGSVYLHTEDSTLFSVKQDIFYSLLSSSS